jgi:undecaprenyl pyrophosphate phosphatase UppP
MPSDDDFQHQLKKLRTKEKLLGVILAIIPLTITVLFFFFPQTRIGRPLLGVMMVMEWLILLVIYLIVVSKMRQRRR